MSLRNKVFRILNSGIVKVKGGKRETVPYLEDALEDLANCGCGISCCDNAIYLKDTVTGNPVKITVENGVLVVAVNE